VARISQLGTALVTANVPSSAILFNVTIDVIRSYQTSVLTTATRRNIQGDGILPSHRRENLKSSVILFAATDVSWLVAVAVVLSCQFVYVKMANCAPKSNAFNCNKEKTEHQRSCK
jgi:hypothetical protein